MTCNRYCRHQLVILTFSWLMTHCWCSMSLLSMWTQEQAKQSVPSSSTSYVTPMMIRYQPLAVVLKCRLKSQFVYVYFSYSLCLTFHCILLTLNVLPGWPAWCMPGTNSFNWLILLLMYALLSFQFVKLCRQCLTLCNNTEDNACQVGDFRTYEMHECWMDIWALGRTSYLYTILFKQLQRFHWNLDDVL